MVKSRYLCSAPRPETWDERADALLKSLGGSASKRETLLRETLAALKEMHADKQKTGPGRKSNAEHAIAFYEYVLETISESKEENDMDNGEAKTEVQPAVEVKPKKRGRGRPPKVRPEEKAEKEKAKEVPAAVEGGKPKEEAAADGDDKDDNLSVASMDTAEFISQHNDLCEVCNKGGELLMCNACNLVFHVDCYRPKLEGVPSDSWVCAYCIMSGVKRLKQNAKARKNAAIGVRLMARMRKQLARQKKKKAFESQDGDDDDDGDGEPNSETEGNEDELPKKRSVGRPRKRKAPEDEEDQNADESPKKRSVGRPRKHRPPKVEEADQHAKNEADGKVKPAADESPKKRSVGRPRKHRPPKDDEKIQTAESEDNGEAKPATDELPKKRSVGRPRKHRSPKDSGKDQKAESEDDGEAKPAADESPKKRSVGRPRKHKAPTDDGEQKSLTEAEDDCKPAADESSKKRSDPEQEEEGSARGETDDSDNQDTTTKPDSDEGDENENETSDKDSSKGGEEKTESHSSGSESKSATEESDKASEGRKKKSLALHKISDAMSESMKVSEAVEVVTDEQTPSRRVRRNRKKATYYDPQNGPASQWQSDGVNEWKYLTSHDATSDDEVDDGSDDDEEKRGLNDDKEPAAGQEVRSGGNGISAKRAAKKGDEIWCKFCMDDKSIPVCCFCACRVCFGKHDQSKLLLCDNCDAEIHTFCLTPPLKSVPSKSWFCPSCKSAEKDDKVARNPNVSTRGSKTPLKVRTSGRKSISPKHKEEVKEESPVAPPKKRGPGRPRKHPLPEPTQPPRKRGRPPKNKTPSPPSPASPRKRGRPRKNPLPDDAPSSKKAASPSSTGVKRGPGRPPKSKNKKSKTASQRKSSVSPSLKNAEENVDITKGPSKAPNAKDDSSIASGNTKLQQAPPPSPPPPPPPPITVSRSGRAVKRTSFHDEIEEGEQHLRSSRYAERRSGDLSATSMEDGNSEYFPQDQMAEEHGFEHDHHHGVDPHFLANIPDVSDMAHLVPLDTSFIDHGANVMPLGVGVGSDPSNMLGEPFLQVPVPAPEPHQLPEPEHEPEPEEEKKPAAVTTMNIAPMVHVNVNPDWHVPPPVENVAAQSTTSHGIDVAASAPAPPVTMAASVAPPVAAAPAPAAPPASALPAPTYDTNPGGNLKPPPPPPPPSVASGTPVASKGNASGSTSAKQPRRKPGARECMQISRRFGVNVIPEKYMEILTDYCKRGKVEHLIRMRERLDEHSRFLESQLAGLESMVQEKGELDVVVPAMPEAENDNAE